MVKRLKRAGIGVGFFRPNRARLPSLSDMSMPGPAVGPGQTTDSL
jgi:hypothetical protein